jgi:hypothetical protein
VCSEAFCLPPSAALLHCFCSREITVIAHFAFDAICELMMTPDVNIDNSECMSNQLCSLVQHNAADSEQVHLIARLDAWCVQQVTCACMTSISCELFMRSSLCGQ